MPTFQLRNSNLFRLPGNPHMVHLGTIGYGLREFIILHCTDGPMTGNTYIEEVVLNTVDFSKDVFANCKFIEDDNLAQDLAAFAEEKDLLDIKKRMEEAVEQRNNTLWTPGKSGLVL